MTDYGVAGVGLLVISDGTRWLPLGPQVLSRSAAAASVTGTTANTVLASGTLPAGLLGPSGSLRLTARVSATNSANNKTLSLRLNAVNFYSFATSGFSGWLVQAAVSNRNSLSSQIGTPAASGGGGLGTLPTLAVDTSVDQTWSIALQLALGTETSAVESYLVEVMP